MRPTFSQMLMGAAATLSKDVAPHVERAPYAVGRVGTVGLILACVAQEADRAVDTAVREQQDLRALFKEAAIAPLSEPLKQKLRAAAAEQPKSLKLSELEPQTNAMTLLLMDLLERLETEQFDWAISLEKRVWAVLKASADRRALYLPVL